ncbi:multidrug efflux RND transporter permease subunit [Pseudomonas oryzihabitans]|uniref:multidrug efflux RND transporter permease subunit n=1 Tax=Pseudomonas oryzihabitans TaxID=47885 RepID=UPI00289555F0|nr:multidrug efflux RND transporter permease subunit [Pseudomonas oryzihabitans]MDT3721253.1 multidrug efflux RND transporter permease subunit [Pseudomonas oryzihabitans]
MANFFIDRPVFAWVVALFILLAGLLAIPQLPVAQYPNVAPPQIELTLSYPGASPQTLDESVVSLVEQELNGVKHLLYFSSSSSQGSATLTVTFQPGTDPELAKVDIQNRLKVVEPRLPRAVTQQGIQIEETSAGYLLFVTLTATDERLDTTALSDYLARNVVNELRRLDGVGKAQLFGAEHALRVWLDPSRLVAVGLTPADVTRAIAEQNVQVAAGSLGELPAPDGQELTAPVLIKGQLSDPAEFAGILLRAGADGSSVTLGDVARVEVGSQSYNFGTRLDGKPSVAVGVQLAPAANALATGQAVRARLAELSRYFPPGMKVDIPYDTAPFVEISITQVIHTLLEAMVLVFAVMYLFLQNLRYTLIPTLVVPVALLGTCTVLLALGYSINVLTLFGMVLAIGILVDDAIVVVENVERLMASEGLDPRAATRKAMGEISGAIVGITLVLTAVFVPMAFMSGSVGVIYRQFSASMAVAILLSAFLALSLTPALCATLLKPIPAGAHARGGFFGGFNRGFERLTDGFEGWVARAIRRLLPNLVLFAVLLVALVALYGSLPGAFLPTEDQGYLITDIQLPPGATQERTLKVIERLEHHYAAEPRVANDLVLLGFSFSGSGQNAALAFTTLQDWSARGPADSAAAIAERANAALAGESEAQGFAVLPPPVEGLGTSSGFEVRLQDRSNRGQAALKAARDELQARLAGNPIIAYLRETALADSAQVQLVVDRRQAAALGVGFASLGETLGTALGSSYVNDFPNRGRMQQVIVQADLGTRSQVDDLLRLEVRNDRGRLVPLSAFVSADWTLGPAQLSRYNGYPAISLSGEPLPGHTTGEAMAELERLAADLPRGFALEWTALSLQERLSAGQAPLLLGLSLLVVFLCLAALYESWSIPTAVLLVVPLGVLGAVLAVTLRGLPNDVFFKVGLITVIGLTAKNAILLIEFAKHLHDGGMDLHQATCRAARLRLRPIVMTSLAFILGVVPLALATGASSASQQAVGTGVIGGMLSATLALVFVPVFFVLVLRVVRRWRASER